MALGREGGWMKPSASQVNCLTELDLFPNVLVCNTTAESFLFDVYSSLSSGGLWAERL